jgi:ABC-type long-subunit fatty acid transport system fused permease/ATPase subunit
MLVDNIIKILLLVTAIAIATISLGITKQLEQLNSTCKK